MYTNDNYKCFIHIQYFLYNQIFLFHCTNVSEVTNSELQLSILETVYITKHELILYKEKEFIIFCSTLSIILQPS